MINQILNFIDDLKTAQVKVAEQININPEYDSFWCIGTHGDYSNSDYKPVDKDILFSIMNEEGFGKSTYNYDLEEPLLYVTNVHVNGGQKIYKKVVFFPVYTPYPNNTITPEEVLEKSVLSTPLYKKDGVEVGLTIENELKSPTENVWGYSFGEMKMYIIKDGEKTVTEKRSVIRKIFNGHPLETIDNIKIDWGVYNGTDIWGKNIETSFELENLDIIFETRYGPIYQIGIMANSTDNLKYDGEYYIAEERALYKMFEEIVEDETLIDMIGGKEEIIERYLNGHTFDKESFILRNYDIEDLLGLEINDMEPKVERCSKREVEGLRIWKII